MAFPKPFPLATVSGSRFPFVTNRPQVIDINPTYRPAITPSSVTRFMPSDPVAAIAANNRNAADALAGAVARLAQDVNELKARGGGPVGLSQRGLGMYAAPDADGKGGVIPFPVLTIPAAAPADTIVEVELASDSVARGLLTGTVLELASAVVGGGLAGEEIAQSAIELSILINGMTVREFFRVPLDSCIPTAEGPQPIPVYRFIGPDVTLTIQARVLDALSLSGDGTIRLRGWSGSGTTYNRRVTG